MEYTERNVATPAEKWDPKGTLQDQTSGGSKNFERGGETIYQLHPHLYQMLTTKYMLFTWKSGFLTKM